MSSVQCSTSSSVAVCQVSLLYGGSLEGASSPSALPRSMDCTGELKSLSSPPAGDREELASRDPLSANGAIGPDNVINNRQDKFLPCQVQTISVSPGSAWGTSVSCHTQNRENITVRWRRCIHNEFNMSGEVNGTDLDYHITLAFYLTPALEFNTARGVSGSIVFMCTVNLWKS